MKKLSVLWAMLLLPAASLAQVGGPGTVVVGGGGGGGVTGLTSCADGTALADNALLRADGTTKCQGSAVTIDDTTGVLTAPQAWKHTTVGGATYTADYGGAGRHIWSSANDSGYQFYIAGSYLSIDSAYALGWSTNITGAGNDAGFARSAAGVVKVTDGITGIRGFLGGGAAVASATALPVPTGRVFHVTGTTTVTSITSTNFQSGACVTLIFDGILTFTDGSNLKLAGDFVTTADDTISLCYDGTSWFETSRSVN